LRLRFQERLALVREVVVPAGRPEHPRRVDAADLDHLVGNGPQERPVVGRREVAERRTAEHLFEPHDPRQVEVVGRLVEQQKVRLAGEFAGQRKPLAPAAGEGVGPLVLVVKPDLRQCDGRRGFVLERLARQVAQPREDHVPRRQPRVEQVVLGDVADPRPAAHTALPGVRHFEAGEDFK
jgi:hypothetical protein